MNKIYIHHHHNPTIQEICGLIVNQQNFLPPNQNKTRRKFDVRRMLMNGGDPGPSKCENTQGRVWVSFCFLQIFKYFKYFFTVLLMFLNLFFTVLLMFLNFNVKLHYFAVLTDLILFDDLCVLLHRSVKLKFSALTR